MTHLRFALAQIDTCVGDLDGNADKIMHYAHLAAHEGAHVVVFPEMTLTGYPIEDLALRRTFRKAAWDKANWLATELEADGLGDLYVAVGTVGTDHASDKPRNRMVVLHDGMVWAGYDKHFLPNYGVFDEFRIFAAGDRTVVLDIDGVRIVSAYLTGTGADTLRDMVDKVRDKAPNAVTVLIGSDGNKTMMAVGVSKNALARGLKAGALVKKIAAIAGGNGGGKPDFAMAGIRDTSKIDDALNAVPEIVKAEMNQ